MYNTNPRLEYYESNQAWKKVNNLLPKSLQMKKLPKESFWKWRGNAIHVEKYENPKASHRIFLHHGVGTNSRLLNLIFGEKMAHLGYEVLAIDNLGYGMTNCIQRDVTYDDWVDCFSDFVNEHSKDDKKVILYGLSAGGMLTYHAACKLTKVDGIIGMCFLDQRMSLIREETAISKSMSKMSVPFLSTASKIGLKRLNLKMKQVSKMSALTNHPEALKIMMKDETSGGGKAQIQFLNSYSNYIPDIEPKNFEKCPILLTQPEKDRWTPLHHSKLSLRDLKSNFKIKVLPGAGHYPMEEEGINELVSSSFQFIQSI
ncbi:alpha/beta hydrolase [Acidaminobacter sp. JC074]|uniref:alpha/beta fold hydrolase n=1 Tax=Acidaminobacter sp. JC074 TaxID=2530199 RepID=UPI001F0E9405|nr:alpha/beta hydrolase [Acidaminobacter sp. JC074]MCH4886453.1 alpha/beta hydrolase [Acidaminobacter sp. JC074]